MKVIKKLQPASFSAEPSMTGPVSILQGERGGSYTQGLVVRKTEH